jgi:hypothetical protein
MLMADDFEPIVSTFSNVGLVPFWAFSSAGARPLWTSALLAKGFRIGIVNEVIGDCAKVGERVGTEALVVEIWGSN